MSCGECFTIGLLIGAMTGASVIVAVAAWIWSNIRSAPPPPPEKEDSVLG